MKVLVDLSGQAPPEGGGSAAPSVARGRGGARLTFRGGGEGMASPAPQTRAVLEGDHR